MPRLDSEAPGAASEALDESVVLHDVPWEVYERLLAVRGESPRPRMTYMEGTLELMSPSRSHDLIKKCLARLVEAWTEQRGIDITGLGSWTLKHKRKQRGLEPDECYLIGEPFADKKRLPDLALEVAWSRWKVDKLDMYRRFGVREVWVWQNHRIHVYSLRGDQYVELTESGVLPGIDVELLAKLAEHTNQSAAVRELRDALRRAKHR